MCVSSEVDVDLLGKAAVSEESRILGQGVEASLRLGHRGQRIDHHFGGHVPWPGWAITAKVEVDKVIGGQK